MPESHPTARRGEEVRRRLIATAVQLIPEVGWNAVSTRLLANRAGVGPGLVHYHFSSVPALLREAALGVVDELVTATAATLDDAPDLASGVVAMVATLDAYPGDDPTSLLFVETYLAATRDDELRRALRDAVSRFSDALAGWLARHGVAAPEATAQVLAATIDGVMLHRALNPRLTGTTVRPLLMRLLGAPDGDPREAP